MSSRFSRLLLLTPFFLAAAGCSKEIGSKDLKGEVTMEQVFTGGPVQTHTRLPASLLHEGNVYTAQGKLTVMGDIPPKVRLIVRSGELVVRGDIGAEAVIEVEQPVASHTITRKYSGYCYGYDFMKGKYTYSYKFGDRCTETKTVIDGLKYDDPDPAVEVTGRIGNSVQIKTYGRIVSNGASVRNPGQLVPAPR